MGSQDFRPFVPTPEQSAIVGTAPHEHTHARIQSPRVQDLPLERARLSEAPFKGITTHGSGWPGLFLLRPEDGDEYGIDLLSLHYEQAYHSGRT